MINSILFEEPIILYIYTTVVIGIKKTEDDVFAFVSIDYRNRMQSRRFEIAIKMHSPLSLKHNSFH